MSSVVGMSTLIRIVRCSLYVTLALLMLIKEKTGAKNSSAFQQLPADIKKSVLHDLSHVMKQEPVPVVLWPQRKKSFDDTVKFND